MTRHEKPFQFPLSHPVHRSALQLAMGQCVRKAKRFCKGFVKSEAPYKPRTRHLRDAKRDGFVRQVQNFFSSIIFTPEYPVSARSRKRVTLVLDLDETLIHTTTSARYQVFKNGRKVFPDLVLEVPVQDKYCIFYVYLRPYLHTFLREISKWFEVVIFTASERRYAEPLLHRIGR